MMSVAERVGESKSAILRGIYRIPLLGGVFKSVFHPVQNIWRNGLARESVREQNRRFVDRMDITLKSHFVRGEVIDGQMRIPIELTSELIDKSLTEGKKLLKEQGEQGFFSKLGWGIRNGLARVTTLGETAEQHFAKQWLEDSLIDNQPGSRDPFIEAIFNRALNEQDAVGTRIALGSLRRGEQTQEANNSPLETPIKTAISEYFTAMQSINAETDLDRKDRLTNEAKTRLVAKINYLGKTESSGSTQIDLSKSIELASNILSVVKDLSKPLGESGKSKYDVIQELDKWNEFRITLVAAESRWGAEGGESPMGALREKVLKNMAERELFNADERTHGVGLAVGAIVSDIATYGGAFALGAVSSGALFGVSTASKVIGGMGGVMGMTAAKEMGLRIGGVELFRGRYRGEVAQVSREIALGKKDSKDASIRKEMRSALVNEGEMVHADTLSSQIEVLLSKPPGELTEREAYQLLREVSKADARMRIADISGTRHLQFTTQNFIKYDELNRNEQYLRLKSAVLSGIQKAALYKVSHPDFGGTDVVSTGEQLVYGADQQTLGLFEKFSALAEAQLRVGARSEVIKWLQNGNNIFKNSAGLSMEKNEVNQLIKAYYSEAKETVKQEQSIRSKEKVLRKLALKRAGTVVLQSALISPISGAIMGAELQILNGVAQEVQHAIYDGLPTWSSEWGGIITGTSVPTHALSPIQDGFLNVRHQLDSVTQSVSRFPPHDEVIDGVHITLPGDYKYVPGPHGTDKIVDLDGHIVKDLSGIDLRVVDGKLVEADAAGHIINNDAIADFKSNGISLHEISSVAAPHTETDFTPTGTTVIQTFDGHAMHVPQGTHWVKDSASGQSDLVTDANPNIILVNNAHIEANGTITGGTYLGGVKLEIATSTVGGSSSTQEIHVLGNDGLFEAKHDTYNIHTQRQSLYGESDRNSPDWHRPIYDYKETNHDTGEAVYVLQAGRGNIFFPRHDPTVSYHVEDVMAQNKLYFTLSVPGHGEIAVPANYSAAHDGLNDAMRLDPSDTHTFTTPQGHTFTYGEVAKMFVDQGNLKTHPDGILGTEFNSLTKDILHLTAKDSPYSGTATSSVLGDNGKMYDFGVVRGQAPLSDMTITHTTTTPPITTEIPTIKVDAPITNVVTTNVASYVIDAPPVQPYQICIPLIFPPVPMGRTNVEQGIGTGKYPKNTIPVQTAAQSAIPAASNNTELTVDEKEKIAKETKAEVDSRAYALSGEMMKELGYEKGVSFGKYSKDNEKRDANSRFKRSEDALVVYEKAKRAFENEGDTNEKKQKERELNEAKNKLIHEMKLREGRLLGVAPFGAEEMEKIDTLIETQKQKKLKDAIEAKEKVIVEERAKKKAEEEPVPEETEATSAAQGTK